MCLTPERIVSPSFKKKENIPVKIGKIVSKKKRTAEDRTSFFPLGTKTGDV